MVKQEGKSIPVQVWLWLALSVAGLYDATLLTIQHYTKLGLPCSFSGGCERVLTSKFSTIGGVPIALGGVLFYALVLFLMLVAVTNKQRPNKYLMLGWGAIGFVTSLGLTAIQAFIIRAWCQYCLLSALTSTLIFLVAIWYWRSDRGGVVSQAEVEKDNDEEGEE